MFRIYAPLNFRHFGKILAKKAVYFNIHIQDIYDIKSHHKKKFSHVCKVDATRAVAADRGSYLSFHPLNQKSPSSAGSASSRLLNDTSFVPVRQDLMKRDRLQIHCSKEGFCATLLSRIQVLFNSKFHFTKITFQLGCLLLRFSKKCLISS